VRQPAPGDTRPPMSDAPLTSDERDALKWGSRLTLLIGVMSLIAGVIVLLKPDDSLETLAVVSGIFVLLDGIFDLLASLSRGTENRGLAAILGIVSVIVGILLIRHPIGGVTAIALLLASWLVAAGIVRLIYAFERPEHRLRGIFVAFILGAAGVVIVASPHIGFATLALFAGIGFIGYGMGMLALGLGLHALRRATP
jgi:uncharacterized membrane protein HdeD (DUF308 family)